MSEIGEWFGRQADQYNKLENLAQERLVTLEKVEAAHVEALGVISKLRGWLEKIEGAETRYSLDPLEHAHWCVEELRQMARDALAGEGDDRG